MTMEQLKTQSQEIGDILLASIVDLKTKNPPGFGLTEDEGSPDFFGRGDPPRWWDGSIVFSLAPEESRTTKEAAELMAAALEKDGWIGGPGKGRDYFYYTKTDKYGSWSADISYTTDPLPQAQRVNVDITSPYAS